MLRPKAQYRQDLGIGRSVAISTAPRPTKNPFPQTTAMAEEAGVKKQRRDEEAKLKAIAQGSDGLTEWLIKHLNQAWGPKSARDLVEAWYAHWRGKPGKPERVTKKFKTHHVGRVSKWLERQTKSGKLVVYGTGGKWNAKQYVKLDGVRLRERGAQSV